MGRARDVHGLVGCQLGIEPAARVVGIDGDGPAVVNVDHAAD